MSHDPVELYRLMTDDDLRLFRRALIVDGDEPRDEAWRSCSLADCHDARACSAPIGGCILPAIIARDQRRYAFCQHRVALIDRVLAERAHEQKNQNS